MPVLLSPLWLPAALRLGFELSQGLAFGMPPNESIYKAETRAGLDLQVAPPLALRFELALVRFAGTREGLEARTAGVTAQPLVSWRFLRMDRSSFSFDIGYGGAWFFTPFPPGGTALNGYSSVGLGGRIGLSESLSLLLDTRAFHHSNGRGFAPDNPAFDGLSFNVGVLWLP